MLIMSSMSTRGIVGSKPRPEGNFLNRRVNEFYDVRLADLNKQNPFFSGIAPTREDVPVMSNDYLGLFGHTDIILPQIESLIDSANKESLTGVFAFESGVFLDDLTPQRMLQREFADFLQMEGAIICQSGWVANTGIIPAIVDEEVPVYMDMYAHASLWEGAKLSGAPIKPFRHNSARSLERLIKKYGEGLIIVESLYSTDGDLCPLADFAKVAKAHNCVFLVDESHSLGTHGEEGRGLVHALGLTDSVDFITASLSKAFAGRAGLVACSKDLAEYIPFVSFPAIFSSILLPQDIAGLSSTLKVIRKEQWRRDRLEENTFYLREGLSRAGYNVENSQSQIISLEAGEEYRAVKLRNALEARGIFGSLFLWPAAPKKGGFVRFSVHSSLTREELDRIIDVCTEIRDEVEMWDWVSTKRKHKLAA